MTDRKPPSVVHVTRLQDKQLDAIVELEKATAQMYVQQGLSDASRAHARTLPEIVKLTKGHNVRVAEADDVVAGYLAWRDESPGMAYIEQLCVHPRFQRFRVGTRLLEKVREEAQALGLAWSATRCAERAPWALAFLERAGWKRIGDDAPPLVLTWRSEQLAAAPLAPEGHVALFSKV